MKNFDTFRTIMSTKAAAMLLPLMLIMSAPVQAGFIQIDFAATISNDGGTTTDNITGQFSLNANALFAIDVGAVDDVIVNGSATLFGSLETADTISGFTFAGAAQRTGYGTMSFIGDYGSGLFVLDLSSSNFFTSTNALDDLTEALSLANLLSFNPNALDTTQFVNSAGYSDDWRGELTFLQITAIPEPGVLSLLGLGLIGIAVARRRQI